MSRSSLVKYVCPTLQSQRLNRAPQANARLNSEHNEPGGGKGLILDNLWTTLPRPPFTDEAAEALAARVYDHVMQISAACNFVGCRVAA